MARTTHPEGDPPAPASGARDESSAREELSLELYKSLRAECAGYIEKIPGLWWQKFILVGGIVGFVLATDVTLDRLPGAQSTLVAAAIAILPILAVLVDARMLEYGLHARAISIFIAEHFREPPVLALWEHTLWSTRGAFSPVVFRSALSVVVTVVPTMGITVIAAMLVGSLMGRFRLGFVIGLSLCIVYLLLTVAVTVLIWRRQPGALQNRRSPPRS